MAKATTKAAAPAGDKPAKAKKASAATAKPAAKPKPAAKAKPATKAKTAAKPKTDPLATLALDTKAAPKVKKAKPPKVKAPKSVLQQTSDAIAQLASDILADRIVPTIEQIKSIAASALGRDETKGKKAKQKGAKKG